MSSKPLIALNNYMLKDARNQVVLHASFEVTEPGVVALVGPSGGGKSLLLHGVAGRLPRGITAEGDRWLSASSGTSWDASRPLTPPIVRHAALPRGSLFRVLSQVLPSEDEAKTRVEDVLRTLSLWEHFQERLMHPVRALSPGEQLIVHACRRLLSDEPVLLLDDPAQGLTAQELDLFTRAVLNISRQIPVLWATASLRHVSPIASRILIVADGRVVADGPSDRIIVNPGNAGEEVLQEAAGHQVAAGLDELYHELLTMGSLAERAVHQGVQSLTDQNLLIAREVVEGGSLIDKRERLIVDRALGLLGRTAPIGRDLRTLITVIKAANDLQRISDHAVHISEVTLAIGDEPLIKPLIDIPRMAEKAQMMVRQSLDGLIRQDEGLAEEVLVHDGPVRALYRELFEELLGFITDGGDAYRAGQALYLLFVARHLERVAAHAANIALHVIFMVSGRRASRPSEPEDDALPHPFLPR